MGLRLTDEQRRFKGVGTGIGTRAESANVRFSERELKVNFWVVDQDDLPTLIGASDIRRLCVWIDPMRGCLVDPATCEVVATAVEVENSGPFDVVTQKPLNADDHELRRQGHLVLEEKMTHLPDADMRARVHRVFEKYEKCWLRPVTGEVAGHQAYFEVEGDPVKSKLRHLTPELKKELDTHVDAMLKANVIRPSKSAWSSAPVFVKKKDGTWRLCLDYRRLNRQMTPDRYPLPLLWQQVQDAAHYRYYICLDLNWGFWNLPVAEECRKYTSFITHRGAFEFNVLPFGIRNSPAEFQRVMDDVLGELYSEGVMCYIDDIVIRAQCSSECIRLLKRVLERLCENGLYIKLQKSEILKDQVKLLGHTVGYGGILPDQDKVRAVWAARPPKNKQELKSFMGLASYLRKFVPRFSQVVAPLNQLLAKNATFEWSAECKGSFEDLKNLITDQVLLNAPRGSGYFVIATDASDYGIGAALMQDQKELVVLEFASKALNTSQRKWPTYEKEAYAIRWAVERFVDYIKTGWTIVLTDHQSLKWMDQAKSGKVQRWSLYMQQFDLEIVHIAGDLNNIADWLSRSVPDEDEFCDEVAIEVPAYVADGEKLEESKKVWSQAQGLIPYVPNVEDLKKGYETITPAEEGLTYRAADGLRYSLRTDRLFVPKNCRDLFLFWFHCSRYGGHCGINRTIRRINKWVWWPNLSQDVRDYVKQCLTCLRQGAPPKAIIVSNVLTRPLPFQLISLDLVGPRIWGCDSYYYLVIVDHATRFMATRSAPQLPSSRWVIEAFQESWMSVFQAPHSVLTDRGGQFRSSEFRTFVTEFLMAVLVHTSPYYPQGNAINEASHKAIESSLAASEKSPACRSFKDELADATLVYNSVPHSQTGQTPNYMMFGTELTLPGWQKYKRDHKSAHVRGAAFRMEKLRSLAQAQVTKDRLLTASEASVIKAGDWVIYFLSDYEKKANQSRPLADQYKAQWSLPARVKQVKDKMCIVESWGESGFERQVPTHHVKKLEGTMPPTLVEANIKMIEKCEPRTLRHWSLKQPEAAREATWDDIAAMSKKKGKQGPEEQLKTSKRRRESDEATV